MNFSGIAELFGPSGTRCKLPYFIFWISDRESSVTPCLFTFPETPEKQLSNQCYERLCDVFYHHSSETQVKEFKSLREMSFPSTTSCRQKWAYSGPGHSPVQPSRAEQGAEQVGMRAQDRILPDASGSWGLCINRSCRIHLKKRPFPPILVSKKYRSVARPGLQKHLHLTVHSRLLEYSAVLKVMTPPLSPQKCKWS